MIDVAEQADPRAVFRGRLLIILAAVMWSTSSFFSKILTKPTGLGVHVPPVDDLVMAAFRVFFAGIFLVPFLRRSDVKFRPALGLTALTFAVMNAVYIAAMVRGKATNAVFLQYTAPMWVYLFSILLLREEAEPRGAFAVLGGMLGIGLILFGDWRSEGLLVILLGLASGVTFALILIGLRWMRDESPLWLTVVNQLVAAVALMPIVFVRGLPTWPQLAVLALFGSLQLGVPYWLMARGLKSVSPREAAMLTLLEPLLVPVWAILVSPEKEMPSLYSFLGGACILGALLYRYWPRPQPPTQSEYAG